MAGAITRNTGTNQPPPSPDGGPPYIWDTVNGGYKIQPTPAGYTWDSVKQAWVPIVGSASNAATVNSQLLSTLSGSGGTSGSTSGSTSGASGAGLPPSIAGLTSAAAGATLPTIAAPASAGGSSSTAHPQLAPVDTSAAQAATFARAKDQVGQTASGALTGLRAALGGRGMLGSGLEERGTAAAATGAAGQLGEVSRQAAVTKAGLDNQNATTNFQGAITERGQDFAKEEAANSLAGDLAKTTYAGQIQQRGQDIQAINAAKALEIEQAQLGAQQRSTALAGLTAALRVTSPDSSLY